MSLERENFSFFGGKSGATLISCSFPFPLHKTFVPLTAQEFPQLDFFHQSDKPEGDLSLFKQYF